MQLTIKQYFNFHLAFYLEFTATSTGRRDGSIKANSDILPGITESKALKVFAGQPETIQDLVQVPKSSQSVDQTLWPLLSIVISAASLTTDM